jgi:predicted O-methyltransferase YrrM
VNGGHSAYLALTANPALHFTGVDICEHAYVRPAVRWLEAEFPDRVAFHAGSCLEELPRLAREGLQFDLFHIDGGKHTYYRDVLNAHRLRHPADALIVMDDVNQGGVRRTWERCLREGLVAPAAEFPSMSSSEAHRNEIGRLPALSERRLALLRVRTSARESRRQLRRRVGI